MVGFERYATGAWLDRTTARVAALLMGAGTIASIVFLYAGSHGTLDAWGRPLGTDFSNVWTAGRLALAGHGQDAYDFALHYRGQQAAHASQDVPFYSWHYPPPFMLVAAGLATLPYLAALILWQSATLAAALAVVRRCCPDRDTLLIAAGSPAVMICLTHGNNGFLTAALFGGGLLALRDRPALAGLCFGLLAYKPQLGLVVPVALVAGGHWRAIGWATLTVAAVIALTVLVLGPEPWSAFFATADQTRRVVLDEGGSGLETIQSVFAAIRKVGGPLSLAYGAQALVAAVAVVATALVWRQRDAPFELKAACAMVAALLATPYVVDYDMVLLGPAIALLVVHGRRDGFCRWEISLLALAWIAPMAARPAMIGLSLPFGFLVMAALLGLVSRRALMHGAFEGRVIRTGAWSPR